MPDLNLIDDGELEESSAPAPAPARKKKASSSGGGGGKVIVILLLVVLIAGGALYFLNRRGVIHLFGKKKAAVQQVQEEPFPADNSQQAAQQQQTAPDSSQVALLETPPVDEQNKGASPEMKMGDDKETAVKEQASKKENAETGPTSSKLNDMNGEYTVQVIAFHEKNKAEEIKANLEAADYPAFVEKIPMKGGSWFRVCIGKYGSRSEAKNAVKTFGAQLQASYIVDKIRK